MVGKHVRIDALDIDKDPPLLWDALGGNDGSINDRLQWWGLPDFQSPSDLRDLLQDVQSPAGCSVNVFRILDGETAQNHTGVVAGMASFIGTQADHGTTEVGYVVHGPVMTRTPAATEAHYLLAKHAFETCRYRRYEWKCDGNNVKSRNAAQRLGFTFEGVFRQHRVTSKGNNRDTAWFSMLDEEWPKRKAAMEAWLDPSNFDANGQQLKSLQDHHQEQLE